MIRFPFRLILVAYAGAAILAWASWATGGTLIGAALAFWFGGTLGLFLLPMLSQAFRAPAATELSEGRAELARELARWEADLALERGAAAGAGETGFGETARRAG